MLHMSDQQQAPTWWGFQDHTLLENQEYQRVTTELQAKLTKAQEEAANPPFYRAPLFNIGVGVVATIAIIAGGAALVGAVK